METGRDREVEKIVTHDRAVEVANLLMGKLNRPMRRISFAEFRAKPRRQLRSGMNSLKDGKVAQLEAWCEKNFGMKNYRKLAGLYERLMQCDCRICLSLEEFASLIGQPQEGVLRGAPRHSTIHISPWGLQTQFPEWDFVRDNEDPLKSFKDIIKPFRDSIAHPSPYPAPEKMGGYDRLWHIYNIDMQTISTCVRVTIEIIRRIHRFIGLKGEFPEWFPPRDADGKFDLQRHGRTHPANHTRRGSVR